MLVRDDKTMKITTASCLHKNKSRKYSKKYYSIFPALLVLETFKNGKIYFSYSSIVVAKETQCKKNKN